MNTIMAFAFVALAMTGLASIEETRVLREAHNVACRLILALCRYCKAHDHARDG
jgi:hypothetical protein